MSSDSSGSAWSYSEELVYTLVASGGPCARADLVRRSGLSKATVLWAVERLLSRGVIEVGGRSDRVRPGPPPRLYRAVGSAAFGIGVEIHRHGIDVDVQGAGNAEFVRQLSPVVGQPGLDDVIRAINVACSEVEVDPADAGVIAVSVGGGVDPHTGRLLSWNLPDWHQGLVRSLGEAVHAPVELENETNLWALAEREIGACQDQPDFVLMTLNSDTGIGGALITEGNVRHGRMGLAGEFGYLPLIADRDQASAEQADMRSLLEADAIALLAARAGHRTGSVVQVIKSAVSDLRPGESDPFVDALAERIAGALHAILAVVDPGCFVLAGDIGLAGGTVVADRVRDRLSPVFGSLGVEPPPVVVSTLTDEPIHSGLMSLVQRRLRETVISGPAIDGHAGASR